MALPFIVAAGLATIAGAHIAKRAFTESAAELDARREAEKKAEHERRSAEKERDENRRVLLQQGTEAAEKGDTSLLTSPGFLNAMRNVGYVPESIKALQIRGFNISELNIRAAKEAYRAQTTILGPSSEAPALPQGATLDQYEQFGIPLNPLAEQRLASDIARQRAVQERLRGDLETLPSFAEARRSAAGFVARSQAPTFDLLPQPPTEQAPPTVIEQLQQRAQAERGRAGGAAPRLPEGPEKPPPIPPEETPSQTFRVTGALNYPTPDLAMIQGRDISISAKEGGISTVLKQDDAVEKYFQESETRGIPSSAAFLHAKRQGWVIPEKFEKGLAQKFGALELPAFIRGIASGEFSQADLKKGVIEPYDKTRPVDEAFRLMLGIFPRATAEIETLRGEHLKRNFRDQLKLYEETYPTLTPYQQTKLAAAATYFIVGGLGSSKEIEARLLMTPTDELVMTDLHLKATNPTATPGQRAAADQQLQQYRERVGQSQGVIASRKQEALYETERKLRPSTLPETQAFPGAQLGTPLGELGRAPRSPEEQVEKSTRATEETKAQVTAEALSPTLTDIGAAALDFERSFREAGKSILGAVTRDTLARFESVSDIGQARDLYSDLIDSNKTNIARALKGERGVVTDRDVENVVKAFPTFDELARFPKIANEKFRVLENQLSKSMKRRVRVFPKIGEEQTKKKQGVSDALKELIEKGKQKP